MNEGRKSLALFPVFQSLFKKKNGFISDMKCGGGGTTENVLQQLANKDN